MTMRNIESKFFFADYGCCIPLESYAWIIVVLFTFGILVFLFCVLATAVIRWMYKRRMRKRIQDLKMKFLNDQRVKREYDQKLEILAKRTKGKLERKKKKDETHHSGNVHISMDPAKEYSSKKSGKSGKKQKQAAASLETTPIAISLAPSEVYVKPLQQPPTQHPSPTPQIHVDNQETRVTIPTSLELPKEKTSPTFVLPEFSAKDLENGTTVPLPPASAPTSSTNFSMTNQVEYSLKNEEQMKPKKGSQDAGSTDDVSKENQTPNLTTGSGSMYRNLAGKSKSFKDYGSSSSKASFPSTRSWLVDSTGTSKFGLPEPPPEVSISKTSSLWKTNSSAYTTAQSNEKVFPHGAFVFEK